MATLVVAMLNCLWSIKLTEHAHASVEHGTLSSRFDKALEPCIFSEMQLIREGTFFGRVFKIQHT